MAVVSLFGYYLFTKVVVVVAAEKHCRSNFEEWCRFGSPWVRSGYLKPTVMERDAGPKVRYRF